ncbi:MAG: transglycosylase SLT domain-containing protein [Alphaproteobacteria bacterium]
MSLNPQLSSVSNNRAAPEVTSAVQAASAQTGVKFSYLMAQASLESGYRPDAKAPNSSAAGLYQFIKSTWLEMVRVHGAKYGLGQYAKALENGTADAKTQQQILDLRNDPKLSASMAGEYARSNKEHLEKTVGGKIGDTELYLAHFLGPSGAERFLRGMRSNSAQPAADAFPDAAQANKRIFFDNGRARSYAEVRQIFANKIDGLNNVASPALPPPPPPRIAFVPDFSSSPTSMPQIKLVGAGGTTPKLAPATELMLMNLKEQSLFGQRHTPPLI